MNCLFRCDQCSYEEWRPEEQEPWLCLVCGNMRWGVVGDDEDESIERAEDNSDLGNSLIK